MQQEQDVLFLVVSAVTDRFTATAAILVALEHKLALEAALQSLLILVVVEVPQLDCQLSHCNKESARHQVLLETELFDFGA